MNVKFKGWLVYVYLLQQFLTGYASEYQVIFSSNAPAIVGSTVTFTADLFKNNERPSGKFYYHFFDNFHPPNSFRNETTSTTVHWNITYSGRERVGNYTATVIVESSIIFGAIKRKICTNETTFEITRQLNGNIDLAQNGTHRQKFVSTAVAVDHHVELTAPDHNFIKNATSLLTFWFIDCIYYGMTSNLEPFSFNYTKPDTKHHLETITIADFSPLPPTTVAPPTTTPSPTTSTTTSTTTTTVTVPTVPPVTTPVTTEKTTTSKIVHEVRRRSSDDASHYPDPTAINHADSYVAINSSSGSNRTIIEINTNEIAELPHSTFSPSQKIDLSENINPTSSNVTSTVAPSAANGSATAIPIRYKELRNYFPNISLTNSCIKPSDVIVGLNKTYAFTSQTFKTVAPISNIEVTGAKWLQEQEVLNITVLCNGSAVIKYCIQIVNGLYNVTGNESCYSYKTLPTCHFLFTHWFGQNPSPVHTLLIIIENEVTKQVKPVAINMYHAVKQPQLSVIVVPIVASAVAVIIIVFGISYYIQSKQRYQIEVADFDFSHASDMEYKTFRERLREAITVLQSTERKTSVIRIALPQVGLLRVSES
ncbi:unnamed protein product [Bemisia tabaci]|uniref:Uncharacterized protein n=1 Tax=Bemisia tabaci TaxID=7038 RepID=A0A9P0F1B1_BEMTA|nr:unnamed protein product [Bemisia tabaci]